MMTANKRKRKRSLKRNKKKARLVASSKRKEKLRKINQTMIRDAHYAKKWGRISKNSTGTKSSSSLIGENPKPMPIMPLSMPCYLYGEEGYERLT